MISLRHHLVFLVILISLVVSFISCSQEIIVNSNPSVDSTDPIDTTGSASVLASLGEDSRAVLQKIGEINAVYEENGGSRFINGQELTRNYLDKDGNHVPLVFNSWLVEYKVINDSILGVFDKVACNAKLHNSHGYNLKEYSDVYRYAEYCEYRFLENDQNHEAGDLCFVDLYICSLCLCLYFCLASKFICTIFLDSNKQFLRHQLGVLPFK